VCPPSSLNCQPTTNPNLRTVSQLSHSLPLPISTKLRLCSPSTLTPELGTRLAASGASWITLHARHANARRRRAGSADLGAVKALKDVLGCTGVKVVSNGNVGTWDHIVRNRVETGADGMMVGESLLGNPWLVLFSSPPSFQLPYVLKFKPTDRSVPSKPVRKQNPRPSAHITGISRSL